MAGVEVGILEEHRGGRINLVLGFTAAGLVGGKLQGAGAAPCRGPTLGRGWDPPLAPVAPSGSPLAYYFPLT